MSLAIDLNCLTRFDDRQRAIIDKVEEWGYFEIGLSREHHVYRDRHILDVGMGGGPHSVAFIVGGAASYTGVDPLVDTSHVSDFRALKDPSIPSYGAFPYSSDDIMAAFPNIHLHAGYMEEAVDRLNGSMIDFIVLSSVSEHLQKPDQVIKAACAVSANDAVLWLCHANYYSWSGHHLNPRTVETWDRSDPAQNANADWAHLAPTHPAYSMAHLNRMRLDDFRALIDKYFRIVQWREYIENGDRLAPKIRQRWKKFTLSELLARSVYVYGKKRQMPLPTDLSERVFYHPDENYRANEDHSGEDDQHIRFSNLVFFAPNRYIGSHTYNDGAGARFLGRLSIGDKIVVQKYDRQITVTIEQVFPGDSHASIQFSEEIPSDIYTVDSQEWAIIDILPTMGMDRVKTSSLTPGIVVS